MNELTNPGFNDGHHHQGDLRTGGEPFSDCVVPDGWELYWLDDERFPGIGDGETLPAYRPESVVWDIKGAPEHEKATFFLDGDFCLKVFKAWAPVYLAMAQHVKGLTPGKRYRFVAQVFPDIVERYDGSTKIRPGDVWSAEARAGWSAPDIPWPAGYDGSINWSDWFNEANGNFEFGAYGDVWLEFTAPASGEVRVWLECKAKWGFQNNFFMDAFSLVAVDGEPGPEPEPEPSSGQSKLGPHVLRNAGRLPDMLSVKPAVCKFVGEWGMAASVSAGTLVIGRQHNREFTAEDQYRAGESPRDAARGFIVNQRATYEANPAITYWEGHNEPVWSDADGMAWYAKFEIERMRLMHEIGRKCVIGNFSTGQPDLNLWLPFMPAIAHGVAVGYEPILGLHEYSSPWMWWMTGTYQMDPNADEGDEGWTTLRYRKVYRQHLIPNGLAIPLVITECGLDIVSPRPPSYPAGAWRNLCDWWKLYHGANTDCAEFYYQQLLWYEQELLKDDYVVGATIFCWGNWGDPWNAFDVAGTQVEDKLIGHVRVNPGASFVYPIVDVPEEPVEPGRGAPRKQYERTYILLHPGAGWLWYAAIAAATEELRYTIGASADDAGIGDLDFRRVIATNPDLWNGDLGQFFETYYPEVHLHLLPDTESPFEAAILLRHVTGEYALSQKDEQWKDKDFGEHPRGSTIGEQGCLLTSTAMILRDVYSRDVTPPVLDRLLTLARAPYINDVEMVNWADVVGLFSVFDDSKKENRAYTAAELQNLHDAGWRIILRVDGGAHFVLYDGAYSNVLIHVVDPWDGTKKTWTISGVSGIRAAHISHSDDSPIEPPPSPSPPADDFTLRGIHDEAGGTWLVQNDLNGWCTLPVYVGTAGQRLDLLELVRNDVRPVVRLSYSYAVDDGGAGTMPAPGQLNDFEAACLATISHAIRPLTEEQRRMIFFCYGNEMNNPREFPRGFQLTPDYYLQSYSRIWLALESAEIGAQLMPGAIDGYNAGWGDWRQTWKYVLDNIPGCHGMALHCYTHTPAIERIWHDLQFGDDPLRGVFYDLRILESLQAIIPTRFSRLPQIVTETNHLFKLDGSFGWEPDADEWIKQAFEYFESRGVAGACLFRFNYDQWKLGDKPRLLQALKEVP